MQIDHMREFLSLAETLSFAETSRRLFVTQSALSRHISSIEDELGTKMFIREPKVALTVQGEIFANRVRNSIREFDMGVKEVDDSVKGVRRSLHIGYLYDAMRDKLPLISEVLRKKARVDVRFSAMEFGSLMAGLYHEYIDVALTLDIGISSRDELEVVKIGSDKYFAAVPCGHRFAKRDSITIKELTKEPFIVPDESTMGDDLWKLFVNTATGGGKYALKEIAQYSDIPSLAYQIESEEGISLMFGHHRQRYSGSIDFIPIEENKSDVSLCVAWPKAAASPGSLWPNALRNLGM